MGFHQWNAFRPINKAKQFVQTWIFWLLVTETRGILDKKIAKLTLETFIKVCRSLLLCNILSKLSVKKCALFLGSALFLVIALFLISDLLLSVLFLMSTLFLSALFSECFISDDCLMFERKIKLYTFIYGLCNIPDSCEVGRYRV